MNIAVLTDWKKWLEVSVDDLIFGSFICVFFVLPFGTSPPILFASIAVTIWLFSGKFITRRHHYIGKSWFWPVIVLILLPWIGLIWSPDTFGLGIKFAKKTHYWIYCMTIASLYHKEIPFKYIAYAFLAGLAINAIIGGIQFIGLLPPVKEEWYLGLSRGYSALSVFLIVGITIASFLFKGTKEIRPRIFLGSLMALFIFHLVILIGRTGYITLILLSPMIMINLFQGMDFKNLGCNHYFVWSDVSFSCCERSNLANDRPISISYES